MSSARCPDCSAPLLMKMDGSSAVCPQCGREFPCGSAEPTQSAVVVPSQKLMQLTSRYEHALGQILSQKAEPKQLSVCYQELSELPEPYLTSVAERFSDKLMDACRRKKSPALWKPLLQCVQSSAQVFPAELYRKVMGFALTAMGNALISPVETALVDWRQRSALQKNEQRACEILQACNDTAEQILGLLDSVLPAQDQVYFEAPLTELFERLSSISWDVEELSCMRPVPGNGHPYESYPFLSHTTHIAQKSALFRNRSILDNRKYQLRFNCHQARQQKKDAYWQAHPEQRMELENRWVELRMSIAALRRKISLCPQISRMQEIQTRLGHLSSEAAALRLLQYREKAAIRAEEAALNEEFANLDREFNELEEETQKQISVLQEELDRVTKELDGVV